MTMTDPHTPYMGSSSLQGTDTESVEELRARLTRQYDMIQDADRQHREKRDEIDRLRDEVNNLRVANTLVRQEVTEAEAKHEEFRKLVVDKAMEYARRHDWCSVVQAALTEMGLEVTRRYRVNVEVVVSRTAQVEIEATDAREAWQAVDALSSSDLADLLENDDAIPYGWDHSSHDAKTYDVEEVDD